MKHLYLLFLSFSLFIQVYSQANGSVQGKIFDAKTNEVLPVVTVYISKPNINETDTFDDNSMKGTISDFDGFYRVEIGPGDYLIKFSSVGYQTKEQPITIKSNEIVFLDMKLEQNVLELNEFVYSENKNSTKLEESTVSTSLIKPSLIQNRNATSGAAAVDMVPGINVVDAEPQIRGASGFTAGLGSKVLIMIDDVPMLRGDAGRPEWNFLPLENMDQIEVIKGSGSVLYGSGASNGVINIRTAYPKSKPELMVSVFAGIYNDPAKSYQRPWKGFNPIKTGISFYHSRVIKDKKERIEVDFVVGGQFIWDQGYKGGEADSVKVFGNWSKFNTSRINEGEYNKGGRINFNTRFRIKKVQGLTFGVNGNFYYSHNSQSYFWLDADTNVYKMAPGSLTNFQVFMYYVDPYITYTSKKNDRLTLRTRVFQSYSDADVKQDSRSTTVYSELQYNKSLSYLNKWKWLTKDLTFIIGAMSNYTYSAGEVFNKAPTSDSSSTSLNIAGYVQAEKKFFGRLAFTLGGRVEYFKVNNKEAVKPIFRAGLNLRVTDGTYLRGSVGQGFRFPTIAERYINTFSGGSGFFSNDSLQPESSLNVEFGIKQLFRIKKKFVGYADVAGFLQYYDNFVEFSAGNWQVTSGGTEGLGFKFFNTGRSRIWGIDATLFMQYNIKKDIAISLLGGYTYSMPQTLEPHKIYGYDDNGPLSYSKTASDTTDNILKYRIRHTVKVDLNVDIKNFYFGFTTRYYGPMENIDQFFLTLDAIGFAFKGMNKFMQEQNNGSVVFDLRASYRVKRFKFAFIVDNLLSTTYSVRPMGVAAPRLTTIQITYKM
jgi:outer membrane receptor protein involved in Fe transport